MPYSIRKIRNKKCVKVFNIKTRKIFAKCTTRKKAKSQLRLLNAIHYNKNFVPRPGIPARKKTRKRKRTIKNKR